GCVALTKPISHPDPPRRKSGIRNDWFGLDLFFVSHFENPDLIGRREIVQAEANDFSDSSPRSDPSEIGDSE
ncbi:MAG: hypothetical protein V1681_11965, partial [Candidatus Neomarinimicrobiota bacterium]